MRAEAILDVGGAVLATSPRLEVRLDVTNRGDRPASPLDVAADLLGRHCTRRLESGVAPGQTASVALSFDLPSTWRPGVHALTLLLEHPVEGAPDAASNPPLASQRAWLLLALGENPPPAVKLTPAEVSVDVRGDLPVRVESVDGRPHRVLLRALSARGLRVARESLEVAVPATGVAAVSVPLVRAGAARGSRQALILVAESLDGSVARTTVAPATVDVAAEPSVVARLHVPMALLGGALVVLALGVEVWRARRRSPSEDPSA